jgi:hypothetical protein
MIDGSFWARKARACHAVELLEGSGLLESVRMLLRRAVLRIARRETIFAVL